jgi:ABC-type spermidine/putrescine transport system permease subunit II
MTKKTVHPDMYALSTIIFAIVFVLLILSNVIGKDDGKTKKLKRNKLSAIFKNRGR